jgi:ornithine cyclodeaminase/alanine dehydrogenase
MTLFLTHSDIVAVLDRVDLLTAVERAHEDLAHGLAVMPGSQAIQLGDVLFVPMSAAHATTRTAGVKLLADIARDGHVAQRSTIMVCSAETGECEAVLDGRLVTAARTAAATAVATKHLARPDSRVLGFVGAGKLATEHLQALRHVMDIRQVLAWSRSDLTVSTFIDAAAALGFAVTPESSPEAVVRSSDVVCTLTPSREPIVRGAWFHDGLHLNAVGAPPRPDHREIDGEGMRRARIVVDSMSSTLAKSGDTVLAIEEGAITPADVETELGDVIAREAVGRASDLDVTLYNSVGIGLQDVAAARLVIDRARSLRLGIEVDLRR